MATVPRDKDTIEDCIESLRIVASDSGIGDEKKVPKTTHISDDDKTKIKALSKNKTAA